MECCEYAMAVVFCGIVLPINFTFIEKKIFYSYV